MAEQLGGEEIVTIEELVVSHAFEIMALVSLLEKKGILSKTEIIKEIKSLRDKPK